jgi:hypothetical protein
MPPPDQLSSSTTSSCSRESGSASRRWRCSSSSSYSSMAMSSGSDASLPLERLEHRELHVGIGERGRARSRQLSRVHHHTARLEPRSCRPMGYLLEPTEHHSPERGAKLERGDVGCDGDAEVYNASSMRRFANTSGGSVASSLSRRLSTWRSRSCSSPARSHTGVVTTRWSRQSRLHASSSSGALGTCASRAHAASPASSRFQSAVVEPACALSTAARRAGQGRETRGSNHRTQRPPPLGIGSRAAHACAHSVPRRIFEKRKAPRRGFAWSGRRGSNSRHSAWEADTLPTELLPRGRKS